MGDWEQWLLAVPVGVVYAVAAVIVLTLGRLRSRLRAEEPPAPGTPPVSP